MWVTDRFSSNLDTLSFGNYRIGAMSTVDARAGRAQLAGFETGRNTNPEFAAPTASLYFIATPDGIPERLSAQSRDAADRRRASPTSCRA